MRQSRFLFTLIFSFTLIPFYPMHAQTWKFNKEKDGIKLYTREEAGKPLKAFKGETDIYAPAKKIFALLEDINHTEWWDKNLSINKILLYEKNKRAQYYLVYNLPWPIVDRDLCVDVTVSVDQVTGECRITVISNNGIIPERNDMVRIKDYGETWIVTPVSEGESHVVLEGFIDPAGKIPDWISNMLIVDSPFKTISGLRDQIMGTD